MDIKELALIKGRWSGRAAGSDVSKLVAEIERLQSLELPIAHGFTSEEECIQDLNKKDNENV